MSGQIIRYRCKCGRRLRAPEAAQGLRARCPDCGAISRVPFDERLVAAMHEMADLSDQIIRPAPAQDKKTQPKRKCQHCDAPLSVGVEFCSSCGLHVNTSVMLVDQMVTKLDERPRHRARRQRGPGESAIWKALKAVFKSK